MHRKKSLQQQRLQQQQLHPTIRSPESSSDEATRTITPSKRVLLNERTQYYDSTKSTGKKFLFSIKNLYLSFFI